MTASEQKATTATRTAKLADEHGERLPYGLLKVHLERCVLCVAVFDALVVLPLVQQRVRAAFGRVFSTLGASSIEMRMHR